MEDKKIKEYIEFISNASTIYPREVWWASGIPSKNRFHQDFNAFLFKGSFAQKYSSFAYRTLRQSISCVFQFIKILHARIVFRSKAKFIKKQVTNKKFIILKTFAYKNSFKEKQFIDPIFTDMIPLLKEKNYQIIYLVDSIAKTQSICESTDYVLPHFYFLNPLDVLVSLFKIYWEIILVLSPNPFLALKNKLNKLYIYDLLTGQDVGNLLFFKIGFNVVNYFKSPQSILLTYENNSWERMFIKGLKKKSPTTPVYSFQHSVMPEASINMYIGKIEAIKLNQIDLLFTSGNYPKNLLLTHSHFPAQKIITLGTTRYQYLHTLKATTNPIPEYEVILTLEGVPEASEIVNRFIKDAREVNVFPKTLIRFHPAFGLEKMKPLFTYDFKTWKNITVSIEPSLLNDIRRSEFVIYWGSACALEAIKIGTPVINVKMDTFLDYDPLKDLLEFKINWSPNQNVINLIKKFKEKTVEVIAEEKKLANLYVDDYFSLIKELPQDYF